MVRSETSDERQKRAVRAWLNALKRRPKATNHDRIDFAFAAVASLWLKTENGIKIG